jgi:hypothetical protein
MDVIPQGGKGHKIAALPPEWDARLRPDQELRAAIWEKYLS